MIKKIDVADLSEFDISQYLTDEKAITEYLTVVLEENDSAAFDHALDRVAKLRGMAQINDVSSCDVLDLARIYLGGS